MTFGARPPIWRPLSSMVPALGAKRAREHVENGALARAIGTDQPDDFTFFHIEIDITDRREAAEALGQLSNSQHGDSPLCNLLGLLRVRATTWAAVKPDRWSAMPLAKRHRSCGRRTALPPVRRACSAPSCRSCLQPETSPRNRARCRPRECRSLAPLGAMLPHRYRRIS